MELGYSGLGYSGNSVIVDIFKIFGWFQRISYGKGIGYSALGYNGNSAIVDKIFIFFWIFSVYLTSDIMENFRLFVLKILFIDFVQYKTRNQSNKMENLKKRKKLSLDFKVELIEMMQSGTTQSEVCKIHSLSSSTVSAIWSKREKILQDCQNLPGSVTKRRKCEHSEVDEALYKWFANARNINLPISGPILKIQAEKFAKQMYGSDITISSGWIDRFKTRHKICFGTVSGESNSVNYKEVDKWLNEVWAKVKNDYASDDIFNIDETGVFYNLMPDKTLKFKGETCKGGKMSKTRITALVGANMSGSEKRKLLIIGKSKKPRCFKNVKTLPVNYDANQKAWMTSTIFEKELRKWDSDLCKKNRKILLLVDNCTAHCDISLKNIKLMFFPPNVTSVLQPMDQGVIRSFKCHKLN